MRPSDSEDIVSYANQIVDLLSTITGGDGYGGLSAVRRDQLFEALLKFADSILSAKEKQE